MQLPMILDDDRFESVVAATVTERVLLAVGAAACLLPTWDFFLRRPVDAFQVGYLPFWFIAVAAAALGLTLLPGVVMGGRRTVRIDRRDRWLTLERRHWAGTRLQRWAFDDLGPVLLAEEADSDGPTTWALRILRPDGEPLHLHGFATRAEAEAAERRILRLLGRTT